MRLTQERLAGLSSEHVRWKTSLHDPRPTLIETFMYIRLGVPSPE